MIRPKAKVRRFDVFAEYTRLEKLQEGLPDDEAKGYAVWLAKVVAARKFGRVKPDRGKPPSKQVLAERGLRRFRVLSGIEQNDEIFDRDIVDRMGRTFYRRVFSPAVRKAFRSGKSYRQIRDEIREAWVL
jgi:hypothetical protein